MFDVWDLLANAIGGLIGVAVRGLLDVRKGKNIIDNQG